jgi:hypothetical protein
MRKFILIAAAGLVFATSAQAGDSRSLSIAGVDEKVPAALGKAAGAPKIVEAPKPPDPPKIPDTPKAAESAAPADASAPQFVARPALGKGKTESNKTDASKAGQVTFEENKPAAVKDKAVVETDKAVVEKDKPAVEKDQRIARADKPRRKRAYWNEARIMRALYHYGAMAGGW